MPTRRLFTLGIALSLLAACDGEPAQRKAFIAFLQTRIIDKPGIHVPKLTEDEAKSFGPYAGQYAIITDFHAALDQRIEQPLKDAVQHGAAPSIADLMSRRTELEGARKGMGDLVTAMNEEYARADARRNALQQPADLKPVFDAAFERDVTVPAQAFKEALPTGVDALTSVLDIASYVDQHHDKIKINGSLLQVNDPALQHELQAKLDLARTRGEAALEAQRRLQALARGT